MATTKVIDVISRTNTILNDVTKVRWPDIELLAWFNAAQKAVVARRPDANVKNELFSCALGSKQSIPLDGLRLIKVIKNTIAGTAITLIESDILDQQIRNWHNDSAPVADVMHYVYDDRDPKNFYLYPVPVAAHQIDIAYSFAPIDVAVSNFSTDVQTITLDDIYVNALIEYMLYRAYSKDAEYSGNAQRASGHFEAFRVAIGEKTQADVSASPNKRG